ncbi:MAG: deoxynucleoside kinase [Nevskiales bacterium]
MDEMRYIAVEGPIGVGKTTLTHRLAETLNAQPFLEEPEDNPFLGRFYDDPKRYALAAQLSFLVQRARQVDDLRQGDLFATRCVADFLFAKDRLFAQLTLDLSELHLYDEIYRRLAFDAPKPDRVVYLHAPIDTLLERVKKRDRQAEAGLEPEYLERVAERYNAFFAQYQEAPLIVVDADKYDLVNNRTDYNHLLEALATPQQFIHL